MAKRKTRGTAIGTSVGGGFTGGTPSLPGGLSPITPQTPYQGNTNPYVASTPPVDPAYEAYKVSAGRNVALSDANALYDNTNIENVYGLGSDTSNPYSRAKLLEENYKRSQRGTTNSYAAQGQYNSGAYQRMQGENTRNYNIGYDSLSREYTGAKRGVLQGQLQTYASNVTGADDAKFNSLLLALKGS